MQRNESQMLTTKQLYTLTDLMHVCARSVKVAKRTTRQLVNSPRKYYVSFARGSFIVRLDMPDEQNR